MGTFSTHDVRISNASRVFRGRVRGATRRFRQGSRASRHTPGHDEHDGDNDDDDDDVLLIWYQLQFFFILGVK